MKALRNISLKGKEGSTVPSWIAWIVCSCTHGSYRP